MKQKVYGCILRLNAPHTTPLNINEVPLENVTREELVLLGFMHGDDAVKNVRTMGEYEFRGENGEILVREFPNDEYRRLARKFDVIGSLEERGRKIVEQCFKVRIVGLLDGVKDDVKDTQTVASKIDAADVAGGALAEGSASRAATETVEKASASAGLGAAIAKSIASSAAKD